MRKGKHENLYRKEGEEEERKRKQHVKMKRKTTKGKLGARVYDARRISRQ